MRVIREANNAADQFIVFNLASDHFEPLNNAPRPSFLLAASLVTTFFSQVKLPTAEAAASMSGGGGI